MSNSPDFIGIGAERAGTSWIYACLQEHPELCMPYKEVHYFSRERNWSKGNGWYLSRFDVCEPEQLIGEYSTSYLSCSDVPSRMHSTLTEPKLLVSLRDPIERAYSSYCNDRACGDIPGEMSFEDAICEYEKYVNMSRYAHHLTNYLEYFEKEQLLILLYEQSLEAPRDFIRQIYEFLGVDSSFVPSMLHKKVNERITTSFPGLYNLQNYVSKILRATTPTRKIWWFFKKFGLGSILRSLYRNNNDTTDSPPSGSTRQLRDKLTDDVLALDRMLDHQLTEWHQNFPALKDRET